MSDQKYIIGIDEVGRGPLAGPVCVCAVMMTVENYEDLKKDIENNVFNLGLLKDSKKLTEKKRNDWSSKIHQLQDDKKLKFSFGTLTAKKIDKIGISLALSKCVENSLSLLNAPADSLILLDGSLFAPKIFLNQKTIIRGDANEPIISLASIVAKVRRDKYMSELATLLPKYFFEKNKGYGTAEHIEAIKKYGITEFHRISFLKNF